MAHFTIKDLSFAYPTNKNKLSLDHVNLSVEEGEFITLCGRSGCGKTTLLRHLKSVLAPVGVKEGVVLFQGEPLEEVSIREQASRIGFVMQNPDSQIVTDKVWHELAFGLENLGTDPKVIRLRVAEMASYFGIQSWFHRDVDELSGGQKQLLNLASIMAMQPDVLILDEPTSQLDPIAASDFMNTVRKINRELGTTVIITEHRLEDIFASSDRVIVMERGRVIADDTPRNIGAFLQGSHDDMFAAMPSPVQIYYGVGGGGTCPLTVREGRTWLSQQTAGRKPDITRVTPKPGPTTKESVVELKDVWFRYEREGADVLKGVSFHVPKGSLFAIVGGNGTGKSTTLKSICNICKPYRGKILVQGKKVSKYTTKELFRGNLAMLPQNPQSLFVKKTVEEDLVEMVTVDSKQRIEAVAKICEIDHLLASHPYDLSGGEQQRAALAKVLLTNPKILLLDEPTKGIDSFFKAKLAKVLRALQEQGVTIIMVSHDIEFCAQYADLVSMFFDGHIMTTNTVNEFFSQNSFYTTAANRMSRHVFENAITNEDVITLWKQNQ